MRRRTPSTSCRCGHPLLVHEHLRRGTDCGWCEPSACVAFASSPPLLEQVARMLRWTRHGPPTRQRARPRPVLILVR